MSPWAKRLLVGAMLLWTALTAFAGWTAFRGGGSAASAGDIAAVHDVASPGRGREVRALDADEARTLAEAPAAADASVGPPSPLSPAPAAQHPVPLGAASADATGITRSVDGGGPRGQAAPASKAVIVLDPGHGRGDPGATHYIPDGSGRWDVTEAESNQRNAELIRDRLLALGYEVYLTREGAGRGPGGPLPLQFITSDLYARVGLAKAVDADLYLAIHGNGAVVKSISGPETWYCGKHEEGAANERLARVIQQAMVDALHEYGYFPPDRGIKEDAATHHSGDFCQFVVTRETPVPAALLEFLFLSNDDDARVLVDDRAHVLMAEHVAAALDRFLRERLEAPAQAPALVSPTPTPVASCPVGVRC